MPALATSPSPCQSVQWPLSSIRRRGSNSAAGSDPRHLIQLRAVIPCRSAKPLCNYTHQSSSSSSSSSSFTSRSQSGGFHSSSVTAMPWWWPFSSTESHDNEDRSASSNPTTAKVDTSISAQIARETAGLDRGYQRRDDDDGDNDDEQLDEANLRTVTESQVMSEVSELNLLGEELHRKGEWEEAEQAFEAALHVVEECLGSNHEKAAVILNNLGMVYTSNGRYSEAETAFLKALEIRKQHYGVIHPKVALILDHLGLIYRKEKRLDEAFQAYQHSLSICEAYLDELNKQGVNNNKAADSAVNDDSSWLKPAFPTANTTDDGVLGGGTLDNEEEKQAVLKRIAIGENNLGLIEFSRDNHSRAVELFENATRRQPKDLTMKRNLAAAYRRVHETAKADAILAECERLERTKRMGEEGQ